MRLWHWLIVLLGIGLDQWSKYWAEIHLSFFEPLPIIGQALTFQLVHNYGAAYGILANQRALLIGVSLAVAFGILFFYKKLIQSRWSEWGVVFLLMGTLGNAVDRIVIGYVVDFINIQIIPVFNIADICINIGVGCFLVEMGVTRGKNRSTTG